MADRVDSGLLATVVLATFNRSALLREAILSLMRQTFLPGRFEILVVDDASTDDTEDVVADLAGRSPVRLRYHRMPANRGVAVARNTGVEIANAEIVAFMDNDCCAHPDWLRRGVAAIRAGAAFATGPVLDKPGQRLTLFSRTNSTGFREHPSYPACNAVYRRSAYLGAGGMDVNLSFRGLANLSCECSDTDLAWRLKKRNHKHVFLPGLIVYHEVEKLTFSRWLLNPFRIFVLPALVKRHPELRASLLKGRIFFSVENAWFYLAGAGAVLAIKLSPVFLCCILPWLWRRRGLLMQQFTLARIPLVFGKLLLLIVHQGMCCAGLIYGSVRFRSLVL